MATTDWTSADVDALAERLRAASFTHLLVRADGAALAAAGILAGACAATDTPYQVSVVRTRQALDSRIEAADESTTTIDVGLAGASDAETSDPPERPSVTAFEAAADLGVDPDPALALAGVVAGGEVPEDTAPSIVERAGFERRSGLAAPTGEPVDALAHTTLAHAAYSGDVHAVEDLVASIEDATDRRLASLLAIDVVSADGATERAAEAIERAIHPFVGGPMETIEGYADVLEALAATAPGRAIALALGGDPEPALDAWRTHAVAAHDGVRSAATERHDGLLVAHVDGPVEAVAGLLRDFRSPEPAVLAIGGAGDEDGTTEVGLATIDASAEPIEAAADAVDGSGLARGATGFARFDADREDEFLAEIQGAI